MGRIKTILIKRITRILMKLHKDEFTDNFEKNKIIVSKLVSTSSRKLKNIIAGYVTRLVKKEKEHDQIKQAEYKVASEYGYKGSKKDSYKSLHE